MIHVGEGLTKRMREFQNSPIWQLWQGLQEQGPVYMTQAKTNKNSNKKKINEYIKIETLNKVSNAKIFKKLKIVQMK
jgi:hypothetical protein